MNRQRILLLTTLKAGELDRLIQIFADLADVIVIYDLAGLRAATINQDTILLSFGSGVIIPGDILARLSRPAYNMHAASPAFPGRDPHHHAVYGRVIEYGATLHLITERVDEGLIVGVEMFSVEAGTSPAELLARANEAGFRLVERFGRMLLESVAPPPLSGVAWGSKKTRRSDLQQMCSLTPLIEKEEFLRRLAAFDGAEYNNLTVDLHGQLFRIDKSPQLQAKNEAFAEFTEGGFRNLLRELKSRGYRFARYGERATDRHVIWRHDVDFSMHRAARLAEIEAVEEATAIYFVNPRCTFYNLLEPEINRLLHRIRNLGHEIGLHFDAGAYANTHWNLAEVESALLRERTVLETIIDMPIRSFSWHNPDISNLLDFGAEEIGGLYNAYSASLRRDYVYCSDSNGYWRFKPMADVIAENHTQLHLLTHPAWWTLDSMPPSERIDRAVMGRARAVRRDYDAMLIRGGRRNITK